MVIGFIIAAIVILIDQVTKIIANNYLGNATVGSGLIRFKLYYNTGAGFSLLEDNPIILTLISLVASIAIGYCIFKYGDFKKRKFLTVSLAFLLGGCAGNLIDRFLTTINVYDGVIDFIQIWFGKHLFLGTTENLADIFLVAGIIMLAFELIIFDEVRKRKNKEVKEVKEDIEISDLDELQEDNSIEKNQESSESNTSDNLEKTGENDGN